MNATNFMSSISVIVKERFNTIVIINTIITTMFLSCGFTRLLILGVSDIIGWILLSIPGILILAFFISFGCFCGYMFLNIVKEFYILNVQSKEEEKNY